MMRSGVIERILTQGSTLLALHDVATTRAIENAWQAQLPSHALMQTAGELSARLALALAPHAHTIWVAAGPGNNGGDGLEAAMHLKQWGKDVVVSLHADPQKLPADARQSFERAQQAGVEWASKPPRSFDLAIDALLGIGAQRPLQGEMREWLEFMHSQQSPVLSLDVPSGLDADTGQWLNAPAQRQAPRYTLSLLTLKPGLWTAHGRDACGDIWFAPLVDDDQTALPQRFKPSAWLQAGLPAPAPALLNTHKGLFGDVVVIGGATGMQGAAILASVAALHAGAGRVYTGLLDAKTQPQVTAAHPALMVSAAQSLLAQLNSNATTTVCGCGAGSAINACLPHILSQSPRLVLDADALNAVAQDAHLQMLLRQRHARQWQTVITPHPLEAARLLGCTVAQVQAHRLQSAQQLAQLTQSVVILKGAGSIICCPNRAEPVINTSGNSRLSTPGSGDVLAGIIGARLAQGMDAWRSACHATFEHGRLADEWPTHSGAPDALALALRLTR